ncbi:MAG TPA: DUF488 family protein [Segeticoccus sp.]|uniref:DUF488 domain-containing protein n=1 Tax=Segeticoccus sp. TaxID=2706531 RepID=UPI002D7FD2BB|nr:DUF488 family protein [Segeticoccus sp.]HET8601118.1 DUF488 family protein [Segeticoccus sp.]
MAAKGNERGHSKHPSLTVAHVKDGRPDRGTVVLVDRVWPRGQRKDGAPWDEWLKAVAPSTELRKWYAHDPDKHEEFIRRYRDELTDAERAEAFEHLQQLHREGPLTLMTATKDLELSQARVLADLLEQG